jgi:hypothetical protein
MGQSYWADLHESGLYRPLSLAVLSVQRHAFGLEPAPYRIVNILLHGLCSVLVLYLLRRLASERAAFAGALLFAVHPIHAEAAMTLYGQQDLLAGLFFLAALVSYSTYSFRRSAIGFPLVAPFYLLSLLCKEQGVLLPALLPLIPVQRTPFADSDGVPTRRPILIGIVSAFVVYVLLRLYVLGVEAVPTGSASVAHGYPWWARINLVIVTIGTYLRLLLLPWGQTTYYGHLRESLFGTPMLEFGIVAATVAAYKPLQRALGREVVLAAVAILTITLLPVANLLPIGMVVGERCLYLPSIAASLLFGAACAGLGFQRPRKVGVLVCAVCAAGIGLSARVAHRWRTQLSHWETTINDHPRSAAGQARYAVLLLYEVAQEPSTPNDPRLVRAEDALKRALQINSRSPEAWHGQGLLSALRGDCVAAKSAFDQALSLRPDYPEVVRLIERCR